MSGGQTPWLDSAKQLKYIGNQVPSTTCRYHIPHVVAYVVPDIERRRSRRWNDEGLSPRGCHEGGICTRDGACCLGIRYRHAYPPLYPPYADRSMAGYPHPATAPAGSTYLRDFAEPSTVLRRQYCLHEELCRRVGRLNHDKRHLPDERPSRPNRVPKPSRYSHQRLQSRQWDKLIRISAKKRRRLIKSPPVPSRASGAKVGSPHFQPVPAVRARPADCKASRPHPETGC
jgi:hypothetical protein